MFKKAIWGAVIAVVLTAGGATAAVASSAAPASSHRSQTIDLVARQTQARLLVLAAPGHGPVGNQIVTTDDIYRQAGKVGHDATVCQIMADLGQAAPSTHEPAPTASSALNGARRRQASGTVISAASSASGSFG